MKRLLPYIISAIAISGFLGATVYASQPTFTSFQTGASPSNGYVLQTNGTNSTWVSTTTLGVTGGSGTPSGASSTIQYNLNGVFGGISSFITDGTNLILNALLTVYGGINTSSITATSTTATSSIANLGGVLDASQFSGADMGAKINAAYAALPTTGGTITVPTGNYNFSTPIVLGTNNKIANLVCSASGGGTTLTYTGGGSTIAFTENTNNYIASAPGITNCKFIGPNSSGSTVGIQPGGTNGAFGFTLQNVHVRGFGTNINLDNNVSFLRIENVTDNFGGVLLHANGTGASGENMQIDHSVFADSNNPAGGGSIANYCVDIQTSGVTDWNISNTSFDDCMLYDDEFGGIADSIHLVHDHFENPAADAIGAYDFIGRLSNQAGTDMSIVSSVFINDANTSTPSEFIQNGGVLTLSGVSFDRNTYGGGAQVTRAITNQDATSVDQVTWSGVNVLSNAVKYIYGTVAVSPQGFGGGLGTTFFIGSTTPSAIGNVGVSTSSPDQVFSVEGKSSTNGVHLDNAPLFSTGSNNFFQFGSFGPYTGISNVLNNFNGNLGLLIKKTSTGAGDYVDVQTSAAASLFKILSNGNVGIGTTNPGALLTVNGLASTTSLTLSGLGNATTQCLHVANSGAVSATGSDCGSGGANFWTSLAGNIYNNTGAIVQFPAFNATSTTASSSVVSALGVGTTSPFRTLSVVGNTWFNGNDNHFGDTPGLGGTCTSFFSKTCAEIIGSDNSASNPSGVTLLIENTSSGGNAYGDVVLGNDTFNSTNFAVLALNSSKYNNCGFAGASFCLPNQASIENTIGGWAIGSAIASSTTFIVNGNEVGRFDSTGNFGIGTTSPYGNLSLVNKGLGSSPSTTPSLVSWVAGSSTPSFIVSSPNNSGNVGIGTSSPSQLFTVDGTANGSATNGVFLDSAPLLLNGSNDFIQAGGAIAGVSNVFWNFNNNVGLVLRKTGAGSGDYFDVQDSSFNSKFKILSNGNVGIASSTPASPFSVNGATTILSNSASSLMVGPNGFTNPVFQVDSSVASQGLGVSITGEPSGTTGGPIIQTVSSTTNEDLTVQSKGTGSLVLNGGAGGAGNVKVQTNGATRFQVSGTNTSFTPQAGNVASQVRFSVVNATDAVLTAGAEAPEAYFNLNNTARTHGSNTAITLQRDFRITGTNHAFVSAGGTIANAAALSIDGPDSAGTNASLSTSSALYIPTSALTTTATGTDLNLQAPTGATDNFTITSYGRAVLAGLKTSTAGNAVCQISTGELVNAGNTTCVTSSKFTKYDIRTMDGAEALKEVMALEPVLFKYIDGNHQDHSGVIAEQAAQVAPGIVEYASSLTILDGHTFKVGDPISVDPAAESGLLFKAMQYEEGQILGKTGSVARSVEENWQWGAIGFLILWNLYLTLRKK